MQLNAPELFQINQNLCFASKKLHNISLCEIWPMSSYIIESREGLYEMDNKARHYGGAAILLNSLQFANVISLLHQPEKQGICQQSVIDKLIIGFS